MNIKVSYLELKEIWDETCCGNPRPVEFFFETELRFLLAAKAKKNGIKKIPYIENPWKTLERYFDVNTECYHFNYPAKEDLNNKRIENEHN